MPFYEAPTYSFGSPSRSLWHCPMNYHGPPLKRYKYQRRKLYDLVIDNELAELYVGRNHQSQSPAPERPSPCCHKPTWCTTAQLERNTLAAR